VYLAARHNARVQVIKLLLRYGGNINSKDRVSLATTSLVGVSFQRLN